MTILSDPAAMERRRAGLAAPRMRPLAGFAASLRASTGLPVPDADPADGGAAARCLLLLETPGPAILRTGFVSCDNPAPTAANLRRFLRDAGLPRGHLLVWNAVPFVIHAPGARNRAPRAAEIRAGLSLLPALLALLPELRVCVLAGRAAAAAAPVLREARPGLPLLAMPHPSPTYVCTSPDVPRRIVGALRLAAGAAASRRGDDAPASQGDDDAAASQGDDDAAATRRVDDAAAPRNAAASSGEAAA
jgi:uracil-DNA glycosylase